MNSIVRSPSVRRPLLDSLPIDSVLPQLVSALKDASSVVLQAPTGAGKTTRVPPALLDAGLLDERLVIVLEPRRVAARAAARRMAFECGCLLGDEIGYQVRFDRKWSKRTRILVVTEGTLVRMLQDDPFLENVAAIVFDEFHERSLDTDLSLGMARRVQQTVRPDLKLVVMSATLGVDAVSRYLGNCPIVISEGRLFPVEISYEPRNENTSLSLAVAATIERCLAWQTPLTPDAASQRIGDDLLVFLPGQREIRETIRALDALARDHDLLVMPLFGELPPDQQDAALSRQSKRKVVLATNVAETSVTVDGVTTVIDSGLARQLKFDATVGLDRLELQPISRASAEQRAGRAGRQQPGRCVRLWSEASHRARSEQTTPEIQRVDLAGAVLQLKAWGEHEIAAFPWFEPPREESLAQAEALLQQLGAFDRSGQVTELGHTLAKLPVHPRLGRLLVEGVRLGLPERAALAAALLSERDPFESRASAAHRDSSSRSDLHAKTTSQATSQSDVLDRVEALEEFDRTGREATSHGRLNRTAAQFVLQSRDQLLRLVSQSLHQKSISSEPLGRSQDELHATGLLRALLAAFPDRLAKRREPRSPRGLMVGSRGVKLSHNSRVSQAELFLCLDVEGGGSEASVWMASAVEREWLPDELLKISTDLFYDDAAERVQARRRVCWSDLILEESPAPLPQDDSVANLLAQAAIQNWDRVAPQPDSEVGQLLARIRCLNQWLPDVAIGSFDDVQLQSLLPSLCAGRRSLADLRQAPWLPIIQAALTPQQWQTVEREAPERLTVPSESRISVQYELGRPPILAVRIQELFGLRETPRIARGRVPVLLHLLAPNYRPQQVTDDLPSFWKNAYPIVRGELRRRYPKHPWPDDPLSAAAIRK